MAEDIKETKAKKQNPSALQCTSCGSPVNLRLPGKSKSVACDYCGTILDTTHEELEIISKFEINANIKPKFELGSRAVFDKIPYDLVGFIRREDQYNSHWDEYLLFNPFVGFRYLTEWSGHWNFITMLRGFPFTNGGNPILADTKASYAYDKRDKFKYFFEYDARVIYVLGEFNWKVKKGEKVHAIDFIDPPESLTAEFSGNEVTYSRAEYIEPAAIAKAFSYKGKMKKPTNIAPNQLNPHNYKFKVGLIAAIILAVSTLVAGIGLSTQEEAKLLISRQVNQDLRYTTVSTQGRQRYKQFDFEVGEIEIDKDKKNLEITTIANVSNSWAFITYFIMNEAKKESLVISKEISYYYGYTDGESWTEGSKDESITTEPLAKGKYYIRAMVQTNENLMSRISIKVKRDVAPVGFLIFSFFLLWIPIVVYFMRSKAFEARRNA